MLFPSSEPLESLPHLPLGGWGGWSYAIGSSMLLKNSGGETIAVYCILDSDYHSQALVTKRYEEAKRHGVRLWIWSHKEIENYFLLVGPIGRVIRKRMPARTQAPTADEVMVTLDGICERLKDEAFDAMSAELLAENRALGAGGANREARKILNERWQTREGRLSVVSGKQVFAELSAWSQQQFGVSLSAAVIAHELRASEVPPEMVEVISAMESDGEI
jgi:hypothetical protein